MDLKQFLQEIKSKSKLTKNKIVVGRLDDKVIKFLKEKNIPIHSKEIYLTHKGLSHLTRDSKRKRGAGLSEVDILKIPDILKNPSAVYFDKAKNKLNLLYCKKILNCDIFIKIIVDTKYERKKEKITLIKTAGYVKDFNLSNNKNYILIKRR